MGIPPWYRTQVIVFPFGFLDFSFELLVKLETDCSKVGRIWEKHEVGGFLAVDDTALLAVALLTLLDAGVEEEDTILLSETRTECRRAQVYRSANMLELYLVSTLSEIDMIPILIPTHDCNLNLVPLQKFPFPIEEFALCK